MDGEEGLILIYFHFCSFGIRVWLCLIAALIWVWNVGVLSVVIVWKSLLRRKSCNLASYWWVGIITMEMPLSARFTIALHFDILAEVSMSRVLNTNTGSQTCSPCSVNRHVNMDV